MKHRGIAIALAIFLGGLGIHRFYIGRVWSGIVYVLFCWTFIPAVISIIEVVRWSFMSDAKFSSLYNQTN